MLDLDGTPPPIRRQYDKQVNQGSEADASQEEHALIGNFRVVTIKDSPKSITLSYAWGTPPSYLLDLQDCLTVDDVASTVSRNCWDDFKAPRTMFRKSSTMTIWTNALCVNHKDDLESRCSLHSKRRYTLGLSLYIFG